MSIGKKRISFFLAAVLILSALIGCGGAIPANEAPSGSSSANVTESAGEDSDALTGELRVTTQAWMMGKYDFERIAREFEEENPGVTVTYNKVDNADVTANMLQWSQGKTNCDIAIGGSREHAVQYAAKDYIVDLTDFVNTDLNKDDFFPAFLELGNVDDKQLMIPITGEVMFVVVNKPMMEEAGLTDADGNVVPAKTWDELYEYAQKLTKTDGGKITQTGLSIDWGTNFMMYTYLSSMQGIRGSMFEDGTNTVDFVSPESAGLLDMWQKLVADGYTPTDSFADMDAGRTNFKAGTVAMHISAASRWVEAGELLGAENVSIMPIPGTDTNGSLVYIHGAVVPQASDKQELALKFIKDKLLSEQFHTDALNTYGKMSPLSIHYDGLIASEWPAVVEATRTAVTTPLYKDFSKLDTGVQVELQKCINGSQSTADTQANLKKLIDSLDLTTGLS